KEKYDSPFRKKKSSLKKRKEYEEGVFVNMTPRQRALYVHFRNYIHTLISEVMYSTDEAKRRIEAKESKLNPNRWENIKRRIYKNAKETLMSQPSRYNAMKIHKERAEQERIAREKQQQ